MKKLNIIIAMLSVFITLSACKKDKDSPSEESIALRKLSHTWKASTVKKDDVVMSGFENFSLTLSGSTDAEAFVYATQGRPAVSPWPSGGSWQFGSAVNTQIIRDGASAHELIINYTLTETQITLEFDFSGEGYANSRVNSPVGSWTFIFDKQ